MGLFDTVDDDFATDVEEFSPGIPAGVYEVIVSAVGTETRTKNEVETLYLVITYTVIDEDSPHKGKSHKEWQKIVPGRAVTEDDKRSRQFIKTRMLSLGVPENQINTVEPEDLVGIEGALTLVPQKNSPQYNNVQRFALFQSGETPTLPTEEEAPAPVTTRKAAAKKPESDNPFDS